MWLEIIPSSLQSYKLSSTLGNASRDKAKFRLTRTHSEIPPPIQCMQCLRLIRILWYMAVAGGPTLVEPVIRRRVHSKVLSLSIEHPPDKYDCGYPRNKCNIRTFFQRTSAPEELPEDNNVPTAAEPSKILHIHKERTDNLDLKLVLNNFIAGSEHRRTIFAKY